MVVCQCSVFLFHFFFSIFCQCSIMRWADMRLKQTSLAKRNCYHCDQVLFFCFVLFFFYFPIFSFPMTNYCVDSFIRRLKTIGYAWGGASYLWVTCVVIIIRASRLYDAEQKKIDSQKTIKKQYETTRHFNRNYCNCNYECFIEIWYYSHCIECTQMKIKCVCVCQYNNRKRVDLHLPFQTQPTTSARRQTVRSYWLYG